jgi:aspartate/methionine/tyrosine aminotransferase
MAKFMGKVTFDPDRVVMCGGATGAQDTLAFCLADPGDAYLVPTPYYPAYVLTSPLYCQTTTQVLVISVDTKGWVGLGCWLVKSTQN